MIDPTNSCELRYCPLYKGDCLDKGECRAKEFKLIGTSWDFSGCKTEEEERRQAGFTRTQ